jgi:hypothetical protein
LRIQDLVEVLAVMRAGRAGLDPAENMVKVFATN